MNYNAIIFGCNGSIGKYIFDSFIKDNIKTIGTTTKIEKINDNIIFVDNENLENSRKKQFEPT